MTSEDVLYIYYIEICAKNLQYYVVLFIHKCNFWHTFLCYVALRKYIPGVTPSNTCGKHDSITSDTFKQGRHIIIITCIVFGLWTKSNWTKSIGPRSIFHLNLLMNLININVTYLSIYIC